MFTRTVTWGDALLAKTVKHDPRGLARAVDSIHGVIGKQIGVRNSFSKLYAIEDTADMRHNDQWRAWLLLTAIGEDPEEWGIDASVVPSIHSDRLDTLRRLLTGSGHPSDYKGQVSHTAATSKPRPLRSRPSNRRGNAGPKSSR